MAGTPFRIRAYKPKTRSGCKTCKIRKVKCDEAKPFCKRCTSTGRTCDGYDPNFVPFRAAAPAQAPSTSPCSSASSGEDPNYVTGTRPLNPPSFLLPLLRLESDNERISLQFYVKHAGPALAQSSNSAFWQRQLLQAAHQHASIQHCIIALGAMYRSFFDASLVRDKYEANRNYQFALTQSNKAIQQLIQDQAVDNKNGTTDKLTAMTCCVLFGSMANLQGQREAALKHLRSGIRMLKETKFQAYNDLTGHPININSLRSIFTGLDIQARSSISWTDVATWEPVVATMRPFEPVEIDTSSPYALSEIHCRIETLLNDTLAFNRGCVTQPTTNALTIQHQHTALVARFTRITTALTTLRTKTPSTFSTPSPSTSKTLLLVASTHHWLRSSIAPLKHHFNITSPLSSTPYNPVRHFEDMMPHIELLLAQSPPETPIYAAAPGPVSALWLISVSAPAECIALRKKALSMIRRLPRREGLFDAKLAGRIGARAWEVEQQAAREEVGWEGGYETDEGVQDGSYGQDGFAGDLVVPQHLRLVYMDVEFARDEEGRARVKLANGVQLMRGEATVVDVEF